MYWVFFDYFDRSLIVLSAVSGSIYIVSFATVIGAPVGINNVSSSLSFLISKGIVKKLLKITQIKKSIIKFLC